MRVFGAMVKAYGFESAEAEFRQVVAGEAQAAICFICGVEAGYEKSSVVAAFKKFVDEQGYLEYTLSKEQYINARDDKHIQSQLEEKGTCYLDF